jgi:hypothetical protein
MAQLQQWRKILWSRISPWASTSGVIPLQPIANQAIQTYLLTCASSEGAARDLEEHIGLCIVHGGDRRFISFICPVGSAHFPC